MSLFHLRRSSGDRILELLPQFEESFEHFTGTGLSDERFECQNRNNYELIQHALDILQTGSAKTFHMN